jgi:hypothetical protein
MFATALTTINLFGFNKRVMIIAVTAIVLTVALLAVSGIVFAGAATSPSACGMCSR